MGQANIPLLGQNNAHSTSSFGLSKTLGSLFIEYFSAIALQSCTGLEQNLGCNSQPEVTKDGALGINTESMKNIGLMLSNALVAFSGALVAQSQGYADVGMGTGTIVIGLASIIIGEVIFGKRFSFWYRLMSVVFGSILYRIIIAIVLQLGMKSTDLKLLTAVIVALALALPVINAKRTRHQKRKINRLQKKSETNKKASIQ